MAHLPQGVVSATESLPLWVAAYSTTEYLLHGRAVEGALDREEGAARHDELPAVLEAQRLRGVRQR